MSEGPVPKTRPAARPRVEVSNSQDLPIDATSLAALAGTTLSGEGHGDAEVSLSFVTPEEMADLHARYLGEDGPTDVLAFPMDEEGMLGDVVVCPAEAASNNADLPAELRLLVVHGVLHLLGFDHEEEADRRAMWDRQAAYSGVRL